MNNLVVLVGNLGGDVELRYSDKGTAWATFSIAVSNGKYVDGKYVEDESSWFSVKCFGNLAENVAETVGKGSRVFVEGKLSEEKWETDEGAKRSKVVVIANSVGPELRFATATVERNPRKDD